MSPADYANQFQKADNRVGPRRSSPRRRSRSATRSGHVPIASRTDRLPGRHARSPSTDRLCGHESKTADRSADRAGALPAPAATGSQSPSSCRCGQSPARPARRSEPESWQRSSPRKIRSSVSTSTSQSTITRRPFAITISIRRQSVPVPFSGCSGTITAGTNPPMSLSRTARYALRQANSSWLEIPCRRAVADASRGAEKLSSTIRSFSAADHRRRRPVSTISRRLIWRVSVRSSIPTVSYMPNNSARRPTPSGYALCGPMGGSNAQLLPWVHRVGIA